MKTVIIRCAHSPREFRLEAAEEDICYIQCQLIQIHLTPAQTRQLQGHCSCMESQMWFGEQGVGYITIDPSQLDLKGRHVTVQPVG